MSDDWLLEIKELAKDVEELAPEVKVDEIKAEEMDEDVKINEDEDDKDDVLVEVKFAVEKLMAVERLPELGDDELGTREHISNA